MRVNEKFDDRKDILRKAEGALETAVLALIYYFFWRGCYRGTSVHAYYGNGKLILAGLYAMLILVLFFLCDGFKFGHLKLADVVIAQWISIVLVNAITFFQLCLISNHFINVIPMVLLTGTDFLAAFLCTYSFTAIYHRCYVPRNMIMIYGNDNAVNLKFKMDARTDKYRITRLLHAESGRAEIRSEIDRHDAVIINDVPAQIRNDILKYCYENQIRTYIVPKISDIIARGADDINLFDTPLLLVKGGGPTLAQRLMKRWIDIFLSIAAMVLGMPVMLAIAAAIKLEDRGPVFYRQKRVTKDGKTFDILKFRSMVVDAEKDGTSIPAVDSDPRITKVGRMIRRTRMDELPQILNIIRGDMSLVGPRPERVEHVEKYEKEIPEFAYRKKVKAGLTGYAQIYGKYNTSAYDKLRLDLIYIENQSVFLDIKLMFMTLQILVKPESVEGFEKIKEMEKKREKLLEHIAKRNVLKNDL